MGFVRGSIRIAADAVYAFGDDDGWALASHIALSALLALFPFLIVLTALAGFAGSKEVADSLALLLLGTWPKRERGIWSVALLEIPFVGHTFRVISMDFNFLANQLDEDDATVEAETLRSLRAAFRTLYEGNRAPLSIGYHFETWHDSAYDRALVRFLTETCGLPDVRCTSIRELVDWLDLRFPRLALYPH